MTWVTQEAEVLTHSTKGQVEVKACTSQGCGSCRLASRCGQGLLSRWLLRRTARIRLPTELLLQPGDRVLLGLEASQLNTAALLQFLLPLLTLLAAAMLAEFLGVTAGFKLFLMALTGLAGGLLLARRLATASSLKLLRQLNPSISSFSNKNRS